MNTESTPVASIEEWTSSRPPPPNLPCGDLLGNRDDYNKICVPLYNASMKSDWEAARVILDEHERQDLDLLGFAITENYDTALHIAISAKSSRLMEKFVEKLVNKMRKDQLELQNKSYNTALCLAARARNINIAMTMVGKNRALLDIPGREELMEIPNENRRWVFKNCVKVDLFDVALKIVTDLPELTIDWEVLRLLAQKPEAFGVIKPSFFQRVIHQINCCMKVGHAEQGTDAMQLLRIMWTDIIKLPKNKIDEITISKYNDDMHLLFVAAERGNTEFVVELIRQYPDLLWKIDYNQQTIFHVAVSRRHEGIYNLLHEIGSMKEAITSVVDRDGNNMLHLAARLSYKIDEGKENSGVGLQMQQMQRDVLWFKEVKDMVPHSYQEMENGDGHTPHVGY